MRYKIKVANNVLFRRIEEELRSKKVQVFVVNEKRHLFSTGDIPTKLLSDIKEYGATVTADKHFSPEECGIA